MPRWKRTAPLAALSCAWRLTGSALTRREHYWTSSAGKQKSFVMRFRRATSSGLNPFGLIGKRASIHPFFMHYPDNLPKIPEKIRAAAELVANHRLRLPIAAVYPVRRFPKALRHALGGGGKVLLDFTDEA
jgi:hypothetical protein